MFTDCIEQQKKTKQKTNTNKHRLSFRDSLSSACVGGACKKKGKEKEKKIQGH